MTTTTTSEQVDAGRADPVAVVRRHDADRVPVRPRGHRPRLIRLPATLSDEPGLLVCALYAAGLLVVAAIMAWMAA